MVNRWSRRDATALLMLLSENVTLASYRMTSYYFRYDWVSGPTGLLAWDNLSMMKIPGKYEARTEYSVVRVLF